MEAKKTTSIKFTESGKLGTTFSKKRYTEALQGEKPVAWGMARDGAFPIFRAMDVLRVFPENYGSVCAAKRMSPTYIDICTSDGFMRYLCAYLRTDTGFVHQYAERKDYPPDAPWGGLAKPDMFIGLIRSRLCDEAYKYLVHGYRRYYPDTPAFFLDIQLPSTEHDYKKVTPYYIKFIADQYRLLAQFVERVTGRKMNMDKLEEATETYLETCKVWLEWQELRKAVPCPMPAQDSWACLAASYWWPSDPDVLEFNKNIYAELKDRVDKGIGAIPNEKYRLMFGEAAPWHTLVALDKIAERGVIIVIEAPWYIPGIPLEEGGAPRGLDPYEKMAWRHWLDYAPWFERAKNSTKAFMSERHLEWGKEYQVDGFIGHHALDCRALSLVLPHIRNILMEKLKIPTYFLVESMVDPRDAPSVEQIMSDMNVFLEVVEHYKKVRQEAGMPVAHPV